MQASNKFIVGDLFSIDRCIYFDGHKIIAKYIHVALGTYKAHLGKN